MGSQYSNSPTVAYGKVFITEWTRILALDANDGTLIWQVNDVGDGATVSVADGKIFIGSVGGTMSGVFALDANNGTLIWQYKTGLNGGYSSPAIADGKVFISGESSVQHKLFAFGPTSTPTLTPSPTPTSTRTPGTPTPTRTPGGAVGGIAELPDVAGTGLEANEPSSTDHTGLAWTIGGAAIGAIGLGAGLWYTRRRPR